MDKIYVGKGKSHPKFEETVNFSVCLSDIPNSDTFEFNGKKYIKLVIAKMREPDKYGKEYTVYIDEYKPKEESEPEVKDESDLPF